MPSIAANMKEMTLKHASQLGHTMTDFVKVGEKWRSICNKKGCNCLVWVKKDGDHGGTALEESCKSGIEA